MGNTSLGITAEEKALAQDLRIITTPENKVIAEEIRQMMKSAHWEPIRERRQQYIDVYHYIQINLL
jgi:hypothetical protein